MSGASHAVRTADRVRAEITEGDQRRREQLAQLAADGSNPSFFRVLEECGHTETRLRALQGGLYSLMGYHDTDGHVPIDAIQALLGAMDSAPEATGG